MKTRIRRLSNQGFAVFGIRGDIVIAVLGGFAGAVFGGPALVSVGVESSGIWGTLIAAAVGGFILLFVANIIHVVAGPKRL